MALCASAELPLIGGCRVAPSNQMVDNITQEAQDCLNPVVREQQPRPDLRRPASHRAGASSRSVHNALERKASSSAYVASLVP